MRGRTFFVATFASLFWLAFVVGAREWKEKIAEHFIEKFDGIIKSLERHHQSRNHNIDEDETWYDRNKRKFARVLVELLKKIRFKVLILHFQGKMREIIPFHV